MHPELINIFGLQIYSYGIMVALAFLVGVSVAILRAKKEGVEPVRIIDMSFYLLIAGIIGAKLLLFLNTPGYYLKSASRMLDLFRSGGVILGGIIAAVIVAIIYFRKHKLKAWKILDIAAPSIALGQAIGRIGCFLVGCCYGGTCSAGWAITFTDPVAHQHTGVPLHVSLHPVQLYNSFSNFIIFLLLTFLFTKRKFVGQIFLFYMLFYSVSRFTTEFFRGDISRITIGGPLSDAQYIAVAGFLIAVVLMGMKLRKSKIQGLRP